MKRIVSILVMMLCVSQTSLEAAQELDASQRLRSWTPYFAPEGRKVYFDSSYEYSWVRIGPRKIHWKLLTERLMYFVKGQIPYIEINYHDRDRVGDVTLDFGSYFRFRRFRNSTLHVETGFGFDADYIYRFQSRLGYEFRLFKSFFWKVATRFLHYEVGEVFIASPAGFILYVGDHYVTADYNFSVTEGHRRMAHWATARANVAIQDRFNVWFGVAAGRRLFDIHVLPAVKQSGYILSAGLDFRVFEDVKLKASWSHSEERPNFIKRSLEGALSIRF